MRQTLTISLPEQLRRELDDLCRQTGASRSSVVCECLQDYLFISKFRRLRRAMMGDASARGVYTDEDVFREVS